MFNPLDLPGPEFLAVYVPYCLCVWGAVYVARRAFMATLEPQIYRLKDPYRLAFLRGDEQEAAALALFSLLARGDLRLEGKKVAGGAVTRAVEHPLEGAVLQAVLDDRKALRDLHEDSRVRSVCRADESELNKLGCLTRGRVDLRTHIWVIVAGGHTMGLGGLKVLVAISRGRSNIGFLLMLLFVQGVILLPVAARRRTVLGDRCLQALQSLMSQAKSRLRKAGNKASLSEALLVGGAFGLSALPRSAYPFLGPLLPQLVPLSSQGGDGSSWDSGSSCGSSCGGGCGGGCGGCGG
jgi:uncharacterized protein (TIGR04222 family)